MRNWKKAIAVAAVLSAAFCVCLRAAEPSAFEIMTKSRDFKKRTGMKLAFCQHPMYLLIDEDRGEPVVGERVPPWGAATAADYVERVKRNLDSLDKFEQLRLNYEFSAVEMEAMAKEFPAVIEHIKRLYEKGRLDFVDGGFSQAHLQNFGSESNWRQFEYGLEVFEKLFGKKVKVYACQETGLHEQVPQILKLFGYEAMVPPCFWWTMEITEGPFEIVGTDMRMFVAREGDEFVNAVSPDGSVMPLYLYSHVKAVEPARELGKGIFASSAIWLDFPDLAEVSQATIDKYYPAFDFVLLEDALRQRIKEVPPHAKAKVYTYWSYTDGVWAEELLRANKQVEEAAVLAEEICMMAKLAGSQVKQNDAIKDIWHTILKYQHHDVHWFEVTDLRRKAINYLKEGITKSREIMSEAAKKLVQEDEDYISVFNGLARKRKCLVETDGDTAAGTGFQKLGGQSFGFVDVPAGGFSSFKISTAEASSEQPLPEKIKAGSYSVEFSKDGLMKQISAGNKNLLKTDALLGGEIKALINNEWVDNRSASCKFYSGNVAYVVERTSSLGRIPLREKYFFFRNEPVIKAEIDFDFHGDEVGVFWQDDTKIDVYYPTGGSEVYQDIPFGYVQARENRPLFPTNWVYCGGLVYVNRGTNKHWVSNGVIGDVIAWGGNRFSNRIHLGWSNRTQYDLRLYGKHKIEYYLVPFGEFDGNKIVRQVEAITAPVFLIKGKGTNSFYDAADKNLVVTCVHEKGPDVWMRGYKLPSADKGRYRNWEIFDEKWSK